MTDVVFQTSPQRPGQRPAKYCSSQQSPPAEAQLPEWVFPILICISCKGHSTDLWEEFGVEWRILGLDLQSASHLLCNPREESPHLLFHSIKMMNDFDCTSEGSWKLWSQCPLSSSLSQHVVAQAWMSACRRPGWVKAYLSFTVWLKRKKKNHHFNALKNETEEPALPVGMDRAREFKWNKN